mmetsp:Transcript_23149/g.63503  ORF Transcript_23149/g.63503 Transcript_23149/m.63503 type:complete len:164 (-) Transcript_23149:1055-1546(-)
MLRRWPNLGRKQREEAILQEHPAVFIIGIGHPLADGRPHEARAADYDDWWTENSEGTRGLNGDILVWNPVTRRRHELSSMGIRVDGETLRLQMEGVGRAAELVSPYHQSVLSGSLPLSIGGGIGQARTYQYFLRTAHLGEVTVSIWPEQLKAICAERNIKVLE